MSPGIHRTSQLLDRPGALVLRLLPIAIAVQLIVDWLMGSSAEYFNAAHLLEAWGSALSSGEIPPDVTFLVGQESLGGQLSLTIATVIFFVQPTVILSAIIYPISMLRARRRLRAERQEAGAA